MKNKIALRSSLIILGSILLAATAFAVDRFYVIPRALELSSSFGYSADVLSLDNFYDEERQEFSGESRSVTTFTYQGVGKKDRIDRIKNTFDVRTVEGEKIISIDREYGVDRLTWQHVPGYGDQDRSGYLFGPRGISKNDTFTYWHVNYNLPLTMVFDGEEVVEGVNTYRFISDFETDQTANLGHLPGVPETRGVNLDASLTIWIEPVSGWLVKYQDRAIAYYYDQATGKRINPWNTFSNRYTKSSIVKQAQHAKDLRTRIRILQFGIPVLIFIIGLCIALWQAAPRKFFIVTLFAFVSGAAAFWIFLRQNANILSNPIKIGISRWVPSGNEAYNENIRGFKDALSQAGYAEGKDVVFYTIDTKNNISDQKKEDDAIRTLLEKNVDLVYSLTTPGTLALKDHITNRPIVFSVVTYPVEAGLIKSLHHSGNNLVGTRNWVPVEQQLSVFLEIVPTARTIGFVHRTDEPNSVIQLQEMQKVAEPLGITIIDISGKNLSELTESLQHSRGIDSIFSACDTLVQSEAEGTIIEFAQARKLPSFSCNSTGPFRGDLVGTVADFYQIGNLAGERAALILEGATPDSLDTATATRPFIYVNQRTADFLGITIPQSLLLRVKEVIH